MSDLVIGKAVPANGEGRQTAWGPVSTATGLILAAQREAAESLAVTARQAVELERLEGESAERGLEIERLRVLVARQRAWAISQGHWQGCGTYEDPDGLRAAEWLEGERQAARADQEAMMIAAGWRPAQ